MDVNQIVPGDIIYNAIYACTGRPKSRFYVNPQKRQIYVVVLRMTVDVPNIYYKVGHIFFTRQLYLFFKSTRNHKKMTILNY